MEIKNYEVNEKKGYNENFKLSVMTITKEEDFIKSLQKFKIIKLYDKNSVMSCSSSTKRIL